MENEIARSCCFTGHRDIPERDRRAIYEQVSLCVQELYRMGVRTFIAGGAVGFDMICGEVVADLKSRLSYIRLVLAIPCEDHFAKWNDSDRFRLSRLYRMADESVLISDEYSKSCMFKRNRYMVDNSAYCISYCKKKSGGSYYTVKYAESKGLKIIEIGDRIVNN